MFLSGALVFAAAVPIGVMAGVNAFVQAPWRLVWWTAFACGAITEVSGTLGNLPIGSYQCCIAVSLLFLEKGRDHYAGTTP